MSHKRKRKNTHNELPAAKRLKSDNNKNKTDKSSEFPFEKAKPCDKIVPLNKGKKSKLRIKIREQSIRLQQKSKEIASLQSQITNSFKTYGHYHQLLVTFANTFDQIFIALQQKINSNHSIPLSHKTMELLVKGVRVQSDIKNTNNHSTIDTDINTHNTLPSYPLTEQLKTIHSMLESRTDSVMQFLQYISSQINDGNDINLRSYLESIRNGLDAYANVTKHIGSKYEYQSLLHSQQTLLAQNWDLSMNYKSLFRHYKYITEHSKYVKHKKITPKMSPKPVENSDNKTDTKNGIKSEKKKVSKSEKSENDSNDSNLCMDSEEIKILRAETEHLKERLSEKRKEIYTLQDKVSENDKQISHLKAKNENFLRQINEQNTIEQCQDLEKTFVENMSEFSTILHEEYKQIITEQSKAKEKDLKLQISKLNKTVSDTKNKLFALQVRQIKHSKDTKENKKHKSSSIKDGKSHKKRSKSEKEKSERDRDRSKRKEKDKKDKKDKDVRKSRSRSRSRDRTEKHSQSSKSRSRSPSSSRTRRVKHKDSKSKRERDKKSKKNKKTEVHCVLSDNDNVNERNALCMDGIKQYIFQQMRDEINRNIELQKEVDSLKEQSRKKENEFIEELKKSDSGNGNKLKMKLQILKSEVNKSQKRIKECIDAQNKDKLQWNDEIIKLKEQNDFLVSSNHKNRAELKRMNEERKLLCNKFELEKKKENEYKKCIAEKESENAIVMKKEFEKHSQFKVSQQCNTILKETTKKLRVQMQGLNSEMKSRSEDLNGKMRECQELSKKYESVMEEKRQMNVKIQKLSAKQKQMSALIHKSETMTGNSDVQLLQFRLNEKKLKLTCSVCSDREKKVLLKNCLHMFCEQCIDQQKIARNRSCPACKKKFDPNTDVLNVAW